MLTLTGDQLGDQPVDPEFLRAIVALTSGVSQDLYRAQRVGSPVCSPASFQAGKCNVSPDDDYSAHQASEDPWWKRLDRSWALVTNQIGRDDLRPRFFYPGTMKWNADYVRDLIGELTWTVDPQGVARTDVKVPFPSLVGRWLVNGGVQPTKPKAGQLVMPRSMSWQQLADVVTLVEATSLMIEHARGTSGSTVLRDLPDPLWSDYAWQAAIEGAHDRTRQMLGLATSNVRLFDLPAAGAALRIRSLVGYLDAAGVVSGSGGDDPELLTWARGIEIPAPPKPPTSPPGGKGSGGRLALAAVLVVGGVGAFVIGRHIVKARR